jgi:Spy/CpxP family protein refolding chaperone
MARLRCAFFVLGLALLAVTSTSGQDKKGDKDDPKVKGTLPAHWKDLGLSDDQKQKVYKIQANYKTKIDDLEKKIKDLKAEEHEERLKVLTDDQKKKLREILLGEPKDKDKPTDKDKPMDKDKPKDKDK